jgi:hypothetical protein
MNDGRFDWRGPVGIGLLAAALVQLSGIGCAGPDNAAGNAKGPETSRPEALTHEECGEAGGRVEAFDTNNDGKPDIRRYFDGGGHEKCRVVDLNRDGKPDLFEYFDSNGTVRRRESCYDDTGIVNSIEYYEGGKLARREYDLGGQHRIDTWDWFDPAGPVDAKTGRPTHPIRRERDTTGDGRIDQWWTWQGDQLTIAMDKSGDGKPEPENTMVFGDGGAPALPASPAAADGGTPAPTAQAAAAADGGLQ